ncbi:peroxisomal biogenesis factor 11 gamma [Phyllostomus discolor]|uniref:Peroxisomal biogenesis factor 11 gamma n=1 Tax=Phyllostomus discolor TaxID=89673 RepID=A0A833YXT5_9CHIR|nr:peroxisomal biogenesis factor 11 gamma [Phyllostomus discolor]
MVMGNLWLPWQEAGAEPHLGLVLGTEPPRPHPAPLAALVGRAHTLVGCSRSLWMVLKLRQQLRSPTPAFISQLPRSQRRAMRAQMQSELLTILSNLADLANAVHWLPPGILWAGRFPPWLVGLLGTISSLLSVYQAIQASGWADPATS